MIKRLRELLAQENRAILIHGEGRAFCAGGDIKAQVNAIKAHDKAMPTTYFRDEYGLNADLFNHQGVYVSYLNGIVMGGGYGVSAHGSHLVATEATQFAMPEVKIGFFPDVGATYHLARIPDELGTYLALTGNTVNAADMLYVGLAHAYVPLECFEELRAGLETATPDDVLESLHVEPDGEGILKPHHDIIAQCFAYDSVMEILEALQSEGSAFARETATQIQARSPTSVSVALAHLRRAKTDEFSDIIARDLRLALRFLDMPDFAEGVRAAVIDKDRNPRWNPPHIRDVDPAEVTLYLGPGAD